MDDQLFRDTSMRQLISQYDYMHTLLASGKQSACTLVCCLCVVNAGVLLNAMLAVIAR